MPFALPLLFMLDMLAAAVTFAVVTSVPMWRRSAITGPVFIFFAAPMASVSLGVILFPIGGQTLNIGYPATFILATLASISVVVAYVAVLICRFVFQAIAPRLEHWLGLRPFLILQIAVLSGGMLSLLVLLFLTPNLASQIWRGGSHGCALAAALLGALGVLACILALRRLGAPKQYLPRPLPDFVGRYIYNDKL